MLGRTDGSGLAKVVLRERGSKPLHRLETFDQDTGKNPRARICGNAHDAATRKTLTSGLGTSEKSACNHQSTTRKPRQWTTSNGTQGTEASAAQTMSSKGRSVGTIPATNESLPQNDRIFLCWATVADGNRAAWQCRASNFCFGMTYETPTSSTES